MEIAQAYLKQHGWNESPERRACDQSPQGPRPECREFNSLRITDAQNRQITDKKLQSLYAYRNPLSNRDFPVYLGVSYVHGPIARWAILAPTPTSAGCQLSLYHVFNATGYEMLLILPMDEDPVTWETNRRLENEYLEAIEKLAQQTSTASGAPKQ